MQNFGAYQKSILKVKTTNGEVISSLISDYIDMTVKLKQKKCSDDNNDFLDDKELSFPDISGYEFSPLK